MKRLLIDITGQVQGVGFRPFVYRLAKQYHLLGYISNTYSGVSIDIQGKQEAIQAFHKSLVNEPPQKARILSIVMTELTCHEVQDFTIRQNAVETHSHLSLAEDTAICAVCLHELFDINNRRYQYPFLHCVHCGPRFSLLQRLPFEREHTTMADFVMCHECQQEYDNPDDRRFYSQTNCCENCGPILQLVNHQRLVLASKQNALQQAIACLREGKIIAIKNTGGYQIIVDAAHERAIKRLRTLKRREKKPFALLMANVEQASQFAHVNQHAASILLSEANPIVLLKKRMSLAEIAPNSPFYGIMLPHTALQHLIMREFNRPLVATSGNISGKPLCLSEAEAFAQLDNIVDAFLIHNRKIVHGLDDSIVHMIYDQPMLIRRARGYIPYTIPHVCKDVFAAGGHLKNTFAFAKNNIIYLSQHMGNLDSVDTCQRYEQEIINWQSLLDIKSTEKIGDLHPHYYTHQINNVQHHHAHVWSGIMDNQLQGPVSAFAWDGSGFGEDGTIWGGEAFLVNNATLKRFASIYPFPLPGAEKAIREPQRVVLGLLALLPDKTAQSIGEKWLRRVFPAEALVLLQKALIKGINAPTCSSIGRLFDAVSALLTGCLTNTFEGEAALALEDLANNGELGRAHYAFNVINMRELWLLDWRSLISQILLDLETKKASDIALAFHEALAQGILAMAKLMGHQQVLLTGGVMQNKLLLEMTITQLQRAGFMPYWHHRIPPNDGGLAAGQIGATCV